MCVCACAGGCDKDGVAINVAEVYDFVSKEWSALPEMPTRRAACNAVAVLHDKLVLVGGLNEKQVPQAAIDAYDVEKKQWEQLAPLPIGVVGPYVKLIDDKIYCFAGTDKADANQSVVYDPELNEWQPLPPKHFPCYSCGGYYHEGKVYLIGGRKGQEPVKQCEVFDVKTKEWNDLPSMNSTRVFYNVIGNGNSIYAIGGLIPMVGITNIVERYSIKDNKWSKAGDTAYIRSDSVCGVVGNKVVVAGGLGGENLSAMKEVEMYNPKAKSWERLPDLSQPRSSMTTLFFSGKLAALNGVGDGGIKACVEILSVEGKSD